MSIRDRMNRILQKYGLIEASPEKPTAPPVPDEPDPFDKVECPKCGCNAWEIYGRIHRRTTYRKNRAGFPQPITRINYPLVCDNCKHQWKQLVIEE